MERTQALIDQFFKDNEARFAKETTRGLVKSQPGIPVKKKPGKTASLNTSNCVSVEQIEWYKKLALIFSY